MMTRANDRGRELLVSVIIAALIVAAGFVIIAVTSGCGVSPTAPAEKPDPAIRQVGYDINVPTIQDLKMLQARYPDGVTMPPLVAQNAFDFTHIYGGTPNVYYGEIGPKCEYHYVGIVVAPLAVAGMQTFTSKDWPVMEPGYTYEWHGRFVMALAAAPGTYIIDPKATCS